MLAGSNGFSVMSSQGEGPATWAVLVWEVGFGGFVLLHWLREMLGRPRRMPDLRKAFLGFGVAMHLGIQMLLYVAWFTPMMIASYTCFLTPDEVKRMGAWIRRRRRGGSAEPAEVEAEAVKSDTDEPEAERSDP